MSTFEGRVCVVTGAGAGIGRELALALARRGARLGISDIETEGLEQTAASVRGLGADVHAAPLDVTDRQAFAAYADEVVDHFGVVNQVYNNAGIWLDRSILDSEFADFESVLNIDLWGVIHGTKFFLPHLIASGDGHVINISSINGVLAQANASHYCTAKFAIRGFTETLRLEMRAARAPVRVLVVLPGGVHTTIASTGLRRGLPAGAPLSARNERIERLYNDHILRMDPATAAQKILRAVDRNQARALLGADAKLIDLAVRALPTLTLTASGRVLKLLRR